MADTDAIKERLPIVEVVSGYVKLTKAGKYYKGLCPFHSEKTPSFMVSPERGAYHCFGCGKGGDIFSFVEEMERLDFKGALHLLAERAGVPLTADRGGDERALIFSALEDATVFFEAERARRHDVREYLERRGITEETVARFRIGYAPKSWRALSDELIKRGHAPALLLAAGLTKEPEREAGAPARAPYDRFRGRVMFPLRDSAGRVVGFSGRIFEDEEHPQAKYLNSPETALFHKSRFLYGGYEAKEGVRRFGYAVLVEGQVDLVMAHQAGMVNAHALSGTSFTPEHAALLKRSTDKLIIAFDGDAAGVRAAERASGIALAAGLIVKVAAMPEGRDPADLIREQAPAFTRALAEATFAVDFFASRALANGSSTASAQALASALPLVMALQSPVERERAVQRLARLLSVSERAVTEELARFSVGGVGERATPALLNTVRTPSHLAAGLAALFKERGDEARISVLREVLPEAFDTEASTAALIEAEIFLEENAEEAFADFIHMTKRAKAKVQYDALLTRLRLDEAARRTPDPALMQEIAALAKEL